MGLRDKPDLGRNLRCLVPSSGGLGSPQEAASLDLLDTVSSFDIMAGIHGTLSETLWFMLNCPREDQILPGPHG